MWERGGEGACREGGGTKTSDERLVIEVEAKLEKSKLSYCFFCSCLFMQICVTAFLTNHLRHLKAL